MQVPRTQYRRRRFSGDSENSCVRHRAEHKDHVWSYDFVSDRTEDGRQLRLLVVVDEYTRECLALEVARSFTSQDVLGVLQYLFAVRGSSLTPTENPLRCLSQVPQKVACTTSSGSGAASCSVNSACAVNGCCSTSLSR